MDHPAYTEKQVNQQLAKHTTLPITIAWDGNDVAKGESAFFAVYYDESDTDYSVEDSGPMYDVAKQVGPHRYEQWGWASGYGNLAKTLISIIEEAIAIGDLSPVED